MIKQIIKLTNETIVSFKNLEVTKNIDNIK